MRQITAWEAMVRADPNHSQWFVDRFRAMAAQGRDLAGEARMVDAMLERGSRVLDAGCGTGRVGAELAARGHHVVGVDVDAHLVAAAREDHPDVDWRVADLAELDLVGAGEQPFDAVVCAGNVLTFVAQGTEVEVLRRMGAQLADGGRLAVGFGAGRGYAFDRFFADADAAGLVVELALSSWDLRPRIEDSDFLVAVLRAGGAA